MFCYLDDLKRRWCYNYFVDRGLFLRWTADSCYYAVIDDHLRIFESCSIFCSINLAFERQVSLLAEPLDCRVESDKMNVHSVNLIKLSGKKTLSHC